MWYQGIYTQQPNKVLIDSISELVISISKSLRRFEKAIFRHQLRHNFAVVQKVCLSEHASTLTEILTFLETRLCTGVKYPPSSVSRNINKTIVILIRQSAIAGKEHNLRDMSNILLSFPTLLLDFHLRRMSF